MFIDDTNLTKCLEMRNDADMDEKHPYWRLLWRVLDNRGFRYEFFA